jgi:hypothetical protein
MQTCARGRSGQQEAIDGSPGIADARKKGQNKLTPFTSEVPGGMTDRSAFDSLPDARDGLNRKERAILYCLQQAQQELGGRNVPTIMLYGRVLELVDIGQDEFQVILARFAGLTQPAAD